MTTDGVVGSATRLNASQSAGPLAFQLAEPQPSFARFRSFS
jgi:hypothetical protein